MRELTAFSHLWYGLSKRQVSVSVWKYEGLFDRPSLFCTQSHTCQGIASNHTLLLRDRWELLIFLSRRYVNRPCCNPATYFEPLLLCNFLDIIFCIKFYELKTSQNLYKTSACDVFRCSSHCTRLLISSGVSNVVSVSIWRNSGMHRTWII